MRPYLKDGLLHLVLTKTERKRLNDAADICKIIGSMSPIDETLRVAACDVFDGAAAVVANTGWSKDDPDKQMEMPL